MPPQLRFWQTRVLQGLSRHCLLLLTLTACRPGPQPAPYPGGSEPDIGQLLAAASPPVDAIAVPKAKIKLGIHRGSLAFLAQSPDRFRGSVTVAGNEMVTLAVHESGYHLRNKLDGVPPGYYEGPPSACAIAALLGVGLDAERLVNVVLGGAPLIEDFRVTEHGWDSKRARERVSVSNSKYRQELLFRYSKGTWRFSSATLWLANGRRLWTVEHESWQKVDGVMLPRVTRLSRPGKRRDSTVTIQVLEVILDPPWAHTTPAGGVTTGVDTDDNGDADGGADTTGTPDSGGDAAWENGDDGGEWENQEPAPEPTPEPNPRKAEVPAPALHKAEPATGIPPSGPPAIWKVDAGGLKPRGDLCRDRR